MSHLILVKHSLPEINPKTDAHDWPLSTEGRNRCHMLAEQLVPYQPTRFISSDEPKAIETAEIISARFNMPSTVVADLHEHDRRNTPYLAHKQEFEAAIAKFFDQPDVLVYCNETANQALARFSEGIKKLCMVVDGDLAVVSHGTVITLFVAAHNAVNAFEFWRHLALPSFVVLGLPHFRLIRST
jgi:broad specificity phosphatase PhoE